MSPAHPNANLAAIVRQCSTKKELQAAGLKGERLATAWQWLQLRQQRLRRREGPYYRPSYEYGTSYDLTPQWVVSDPTDRTMCNDYRSRFIAWEYRRLVQTWPMRHKFQEGFSNRIQRQIMKDWPYTWQDKKYHLSLGYQKAGVEVKGSRSASSYDTYFVTLHYNLVTHEAVVIGGLLTIRAKEHAHSADYPCIWLERNKSGPGLYTVQGRIEAHDHHIVEDPALLGKKEETKLKRRLSRLKSTPPPGSPWVTREISLAAGNCERGTDQFIRNVVEPHLKKQGGSYIPGLAMHISALLKLRRDHYTLRIAKHIRHAA
jgi:hypothetical protein